MFPALFYWLAESLAEGIHCVPRGTRVCGEAGKAKRLLVYSTYPKLMTPEEHYKIRCQEFISSGKVVATVFKNGASVAGWPELYPSPPEGWPRKKRGKIRSQSGISMLRCGWTLDNANASWEVMNTLTFRVPHSDPKSVLRRWLSLMNLAGNTDARYAWVMEFQSRGIIHFHVLSELSTWHKAWGKDSLHIERVGRGCYSREVFRGRAETWACDRWVETVGDNSSRFEAFQYGGTMEPVRACHSVGRYMGCYLAKKAQKSLPEATEGAGRWWYLSRAAAPVPRGTFVVQKWDFPGPLALVYNAKVIGGNLDLSEASDIPQ